MSYDDRALHGFAFGVDAIKSIILMCAAVDKVISVEKAVSLARLELEVQVKVHFNLLSLLIYCTLVFNFQTEKWGNVEWAHDLELHDTTSRLAAATLFVQLGSSHHLTKEKSIQS